MLSEAHIDGCGLRILSYIRRLERHGNAMQNGYDGSCFLVYFRNDIDSAYLVNHICAWRSPKRNAHLRLMVPKTRYKLRRRRVLNA